MLHFFVFVTVVHTVSFFFFFKQKTAYEMRISDWSSDVCSSDLRATGHVCGEFVHGTYKTPGMLRWRCLRRRRPAPVPAPADRRPARADRHPRPGDRQSVV